MPSTLNDSRSVFTDPVNLHAEGRIGERIDKNLRSHSFQIAALCGRTRSWENLGEFRVPAGLRV